MARHHYHRQRRGAMLSLAQLVPLCLLAQPGRTAEGTTTPGLPFVINTWGGPFTVATDAAYDALVGARTTAPASVLDAVEIGCSACEAAQCDGTVGYGGSPDEACETTLDAMIMDGATMKAGAVANLRRVRDAVSVARRVLDHTAHTLLAGDQATRFAVENGFAEESLSTTASLAACAEWRAAGCPGNYRLNVAPDPRASCGPYAPLPVNGSSSSSAAVAEPGMAAEVVAAAAAPDEGGAAAPSHDTISMIAIDANGAMAAATSTNGASHKVPGRVGDGPIVGSGSYVDSDVGGCGATGDGDIMMRFLPCYQAVENLRRGMTPVQAAEDVVRRMLRKYPSMSSGVVVVNTKGEHGGAGSGWTFTYSYRGGLMEATKVVTVPPLEATDAGLERMVGEDAQAQKSLLS